MTRCTPMPVPRNTLEGPVYLDLDSRVSRDFHLSRDRNEKGNVLTVVFDAFNVLNRLNPGTYVGTVTSPFFAQPITARPPRQLQLSLRFKF